jgi:molecular chaperone DnaK (HSP70)
MERRRTSMRLGIDFGTTRTVVAAAHDGRHPVATFEVDGDHRGWIPGVAVEVDGEIVCGWEAVARMADARGAVRSIKRAITGLAPDDPVEALPSRPSALALVERFARHVCDQIRRASNLAPPEDEPLRAAIAVPANATSRQRWITIEAFRRAGVEIVVVINEPTAAAIEYAHRYLGPENKRSPKRYVVVYDLGGGTFDTSAVSLRGRRFELLATEGIARLGGDDFDEAILRLALEKAGCAHDTLASPVLARLLDQARAAKEALTERSRHAMVDLAAVLPDAPPVVLDAAAVVAACEPLVAQTVALLDRLFSGLPAHGIDPDNARELGAVYVVGGGASFVGVLRALRARLGRKVQLAPIPHAATAIGLAIAADPESGVYVQEATTRHFGVWREAAGGREKVFDRIFGKDTLPDGEFVVHRRYRPRHTVGHLRFLECSELGPDGGPAGALTLWREVLFPYHPALRDREERELTVSTDASVFAEEIEEIYRYAPTGEITVRIENRTRGYGRTYELGRVA